MQISGLLLVPATSCQYLILSWIHLIVFGRVNYHFSRSSWLWPAASRIFRNTLGRLKQQYKKRSKDLRVSEMYKLCFFWLRTQGRLGFQIGMRCRWQGISIIFCLRKLVSTYGTPPLGLKDQKQLMRQVRVWLSLCFIEREIAAGTVMISRIEAIDIGLLQRFPRHALFKATDLRVTSLVKIVQLRNILIFPLLWVFSS